MLSPRAAVAAAFGTQGMVFISLTTRLPRLQDRWDVSELELSGLLLMMVLLAGVGSVLAERLARSRESSVMLRAGLLVITIAVPVALASPTPWLFVGALGCYGVALGVVDATTNMQAVALEHAYRRPILPSFHSAWTFGGILGAGLALVTAQVPLPWIGLVGAIPLVVAAAPFVRRTASWSAAAETVRVPWRPLLLVGLGMVLFYMVDTAAQTWGATYLDSTFTTPDALVALAVFPYLVASGIFRLGGDGLVARYGATAVVRVGGVAAFLALALVVFAPTWPLAVVGFTVLGAGVAVIAPLSFSAAARIAGDSAGARDADDPDARMLRVDAVIARFNQFNYAGALLGAVMTGAVGSGNLRVGFAVPMVLILGILPLASAFAPRTPTGTGAAS